MHPRLTRLDTLAAFLMDDDDVVAVLGLGSAGIEHARFDEYSDIDFFVVVDTAAARSRYLEQLDWLAAMGTPAFQFRNDRNGRKVLFDDGLFVEYAVFTPEALRAIPLAGARIIRARPGVDPDLLAGAPVPPAAADDTVEFHLGEALTNLFVGLHRELRGERLTAGRFIQVFAVDRILALSRLADHRSHVGRDPFEPTRRVEAMHPELVEPLGRILLGYHHNVRSARAVLAWLREHHTPDPVIAGAIDALIDAADARRGSSG